MQYSYLEYRNNNTDCPDQNPSSTICDLSCRKMSIRKDCGKRWKDFNKRHDKKGCAISSPAFYNRFVHESCKKSCNNCGKHFLGVNHIKFQDPLATDAGAPSRVLVVTL